MAKAPTNCGHKKVIAIAWTWVPGESVCRQREDTHRNYHSFILILSQISLLLLSLFKWL